MTSPTVAVTTLVALVWVMLLGVPAVVRWAS